MNLIKKVNAIEPKRCFVVSQYVRKHGVKKRYLAQLTKSEFRNRLQAAKKSVLRMAEAELDKVIAKAYKKRLRAYNKVNWHVGSVKTAEVGVWRGAGGLPIAWTSGSLAKTAIHVAGSLRGNAKEISSRAKRAIPGIMGIARLIQKEKYQYPIILPGGTMGRKGLKKMRGDIDDGCMRAIAFAVSGKKSFNAYIGTKG